MEFMGSPVVAAMIAVLCAAATTHLLAREKRVKLEAKAEETERRVVALEDARVGAPDFQLVWDRLTEMREDLRSIRDRLDRLAERAPARA